MKIPSESKSGSSYSGSSFSFSFSFSLTLSLLFMTLKKKEGRMDYIYTATGIYFPPDFVDDRHRFFL